MGKLFVWFPIMALMVIYILSVDCKHKKETANKTDNLTKVHVKHHHRAHKGKSVKRDLHKHYAQNVPVNPSERVMSANDQPGFHVDIPILYGNSKKEKRQIQNDNSSAIVSQGNITLDMTSRLLGLQPAIENNMTFYETIDGLNSKSQPQVAEGFSILTKIIGNVSDKNEQKTAEAYLPPEESKLKTTLSRNFDVVNENSSLTDSNSKESPLLESGSFNVQPAPQVQTDFKDSKSNESVLIESRTLNVQSMLQGDIVLSEFNSNDSESVKSRSQYVQPVPPKNSSPNYSNTNESALVHSTILDVQPIPQANTDLKEFNSSESVLIERSRSDVQILPQANTPNNDSISNESPLNKSTNLYVNQNPVSQENTDHVEIKNNDSSPVESLTFDVQPVTKGNTTFSESSRNESLLLESNILDLQPVSQEDTPINESKIKVPIV